MSVSLALESFLVETKALRATLSGKVDFVTYLEVLIRLWGNIFLAERATKSA